MKQKLVNWIDAQLGRLLLAAAAVWVAVAVYLNGAMPLPATLTTVPNDPVKVQLDTDRLAAATGETYFVAGPAEKYNDGTKFVFVQPKVEIKFYPVDIGIPPMGVMRPPQVLPDPGPSLEGADKLPRFGDEFPPLTVADKAPAAGAAAGMGMGVAPPATGAGVAKPPAGAPPPPKLPVTTTPGGKPPGPK